MEIRNKMNFMNMKAKCIGFSKQHGDNEDQLNRILECQQDGVKRFHIEQIIPIDDRGNDYFWIFYRGEFPNKQDWEKKKK